MKRKCVLGVLKTEEGLRIKEEMLAWLEPFYDVETVEVEPPNDVEFELPFLKRACEVALESRESVLYLHTKGAAMPNRAQPIVREMWRRVFTNERDTYFKVVDERNEAAASALFVAPKRKICWYNGFVLNVKAAENILKVLKVHEDRYWFEQSMLSEANVDVVGPLMYEEGNQVWQMTERYVLNNKMYKNGIILACTSWKERIHLLTTTLDSIAKNTILPEVVEINLSEEEFPDKEKNLPNELVNYTKLNIKINWVGKNINTFKKLIPTLIKYKNQDVRIITFDDDIVYDRDFIKKLVEESDNYPESVISNNICQGTLFSQQCVNGRATLYKPRFFTNFLWEGLNPDIINTKEDDLWYSFVLYLTGIRDVRYVPISMTLLENRSKKVYDTNNTVKVLYKYLNRLILNNSDSILNNLTLLTCNYNTEILTKCMIKSLFKQLKREIPVVIMDNSNSEPCSEELKRNYLVVDNTNYRITGDQHQISRNHCKSIDYALKHYIKTKYVLLCDNDILFKPEILTLLNRSVDFDAIGEVGSTDGKRTRLFPFLCIFNIDIFKTINYYDPNNCMNDVNSILTKEGFLDKDVSTNIKGNFGDTGTSVLNEIEDNALNLIKISINNFMIHYASGSYDKNRFNNSEQWLNNYKGLWV